MGSGYFFAKITRERHILNGALSKRANFCKISHGRARNIGDST